jgi:hypothetical protein
MRLRVGNWRIALNTLIRVSWSRPFPKIHVHEKFEKQVKWILRGLTIIGIGTSILTLEPIQSFLLSIGLLLIEQFFERVIFDYSIFIVQPFPDFKVDLNQWVTNGYLLPASPELQKQYNLLNHFGPAYKDKDYAIKFFTYLTSWNQGDNDDKDDNICLSFVLEDDNSYTTYLYANPNRKWLDEMFNDYKESAKYEKYGKEQQSMVMQMIYWKNLDIVEGSWFPIFIKAQPQKGQFFFVPFYMDNKKPIPIDEIKVLKYNYRLRKRADLTKADIEYYHK